MKRVHRAVIHNSEHSEHLDQRIESIWFDTGGEAIRAGKGGLEFYGGTKYTIESKEDTK